MSGLYCTSSCLDEAHEIAQEITHPEGSFWHAIMHRQEPDAGNSGYWFNRVGAHAIFPALRDAAAEIGVNFGARWNPHLFIDFCERARRQPGSEMERQALEVQRGRMATVVRSLRGPAATRVDEIARRDLSGANGTLDCTVDYAMEPVAAVFRTTETAREAYAELRRAGFYPDDINL